MTDEELRVRAIQELEFYKKDDTFMLADITVDLAIKALEQMPVTTTAGEGGVIYYPQVEGVTPTVIDAGKQEPCEGCEYKLRGEVEQKTGYWEKTTDGHCYWYKCSCCGTKVPKTEWGSDYFSPYCPECGAKMVEPQERSGER